MKYVTSGEWRLFWTVSTILSVVAALITAVAVLMGRPAIPEGVLPPQNPFHTNVDSTIPHELFLNDYVFAQPGGHWLEAPWNQQDKKSPSWTRKELLPYWVPPSQLKLFDLPQENDRRIHKLFQEVP